MKNTRLLATAIAMLAAIAPAATGTYAQTLTINLKDGSTVTYQTAEVDSITFKEAAPADENNLLNEKYIPNEGFRNWIDQNLGDGSGIYTLEQAEAYDGEIDLSRVEDVTDITGIEYFKNLTSLVGEDSYFGDFNVGALKKLKNLKIINTKISKLDFTGLENLEKAYISRNKISVLNLAANPNLRILYCDCNELTSIDLTGCTGLEELVCSINEISSLTLPECPLEIFSAHTNPISSIDLSHVAGTLDLVSLSSCNLNSLDLTGASKLTYLECSDNPLQTAPILAGCTKLESMRMENITTEMGDMDFSECPALNMLRLDYSKVGTKIDLTSCKKLYELSLQGCCLNEINLTGLINLGYVNVSDNNYQRLDVSAADGIYSLYSNRITSNNAQIKVWEDFDIENADQYGFYVDETVTLVTEFSN